MCDCGPRIQLCQQTYTGLRFFRPLLLFLFSEISLSTPPTLSKSFEKRNNVNLSLIDVNYLPFLFYASEGE